MHNINIIIIRGGKRSIHIVLLFLFSPNKFHKVISGIIGSKNVYNTISHKGYKKSPTMFKVIV